MISHAVCDSIRREILLSGRDPRYSLAAYLFVLEGLEYFRLQTGERRHVSGQELSICLLDFAVKQFGPLAKTVFKQWSILSVRDFGYLVYNLIDIQVLQKQPADTLEDFFIDVDMDAYFSSKEYFPVQRELICRV